MRVVAMVLNVVPQAPERRMRNNETGRLLENANIINKQPKMILATIIVQPLYFMSPKLETVIAPITPPIPLKVGKRPSTIGPARRTSRAIIGNMDVAEKANVSVRNTAVIIVRKRRSP